MKPGIQSRNMGSRQFYITSLTAIFASLAPAEEAAAQEARRDSARTATVAPAPEYRASGLKEMILGRGWRDLWVTPVRAPIFDMDTYAGGIKFQERGGGKQSLSLHFVEQNGWGEHQFRSVNKFPLIQAMPPALRGTLSGDIIQDEVSHLLPGAPLIVPPLLEALGALHVTPALYVMPDEPRLGIYRDTFALMLGTVELSPKEAPDEKPGFAGSTKILGMDKFLDTIQSSRVHRFDEKELFALRLMDFLINDNDRGSDNMRVARFGTDGDYHWRPLPRDRDRAFTNADGLLVKFLIRPVYPKLIAFNTAYDLEGLVFTGHEIDRRLLQRVTRRDAEEIGRRVTSTITNEVIEKVIQLLPREWRTQTTEHQRLRRILRARRDQIPDVAREFYEWLATEVDVHGTDQDERAEIERHANGRVTVTLIGADKPLKGQQYYQRTFDPAETNEVRVYLHDGKDAAVVRGASSDGIKIRIIGGGGDDVLADSTSGKGVRFYDEKGDNRFVTAKSTKVSERKWDEPKEGAGTRFDAPWRPDWGGSSGFGPTFSFAHGAGLVVGFGPRYKTYGFRRLPHRVEASANFLLGLGNGLPGVNAKVDYRAENSPVALVLNTRATKFEAFSFRGFGNKSPDLTTSRANVDQDLIAVEPSYVYQVGWRKREASGGAIMLGDSMPAKLRPLAGKIEAGPVLYWTDAKAPPSSPYALEAANGRDVQGRVGGRVMVDLDMTPAGAVPDRGFTFESELTGYPALWDVNDTFGTAAMAAAVYVPLPGEGTHFAVRAGGAVASSSVPVLHAPALGGRQNLRGYSWRRFTGDKTAFASAELRVPVGVLPLFIRWQTGVFGLADAGRVWFDGESNGNWHTGFGGGIWLSSLGQTVSIAYAHGDKGRFYLQKGMSF
ncbi:MAG TPA: hypothetical protein VHM24_07730 [Gemmatimonadaceae bacterium]|nr:hypothetical protein [Gemmatimonadaceae bacterium]